MIIASLLNGAAAVLAAFNVFTIEGVPSFVSIYSVKELGGGELIPDKGYYRIENGSIAVVTYETDSSHIFADGSYFAGQSKRITEDCVITASTPDVRQKYYSVTLNKNGGECEDITMYAYGLGVTLPTPTKTGNTFYGWYTNSSFVGDSVYKIAEDDYGNKSFWAKFEPNVYTVSLYKRGGTCEDLTNYTYGIGAILPEAERHGYSFKGWFDNDEFTGDRVYKIKTTDTGNKEFWALWSNAVYNVTLHKNGATCTDLKEYQYGTTTALPRDVKKRGHTFVGWFDNSACEGSHVDVIGPSEYGDKHFWAKLDANVYSVMLHKNGGECEDLTNYTYGVGAALPEPEKRGNEFRGWFTNEAFIGSAWSSIGSSAMGNFDFYAKWSNCVYNIKWNLNGGYVGNPERLFKTYTYGEGTEFFEECSRTGAVWYGWYTNNTYTGNEQYYVLDDEIGDREYWACFTNKKYKVTLNKNEGILLDPDVTNYEYGIGATLPRMSKYGHNFLGWFDNASCVGEKVEKITKTDTEDKTFWAGFSPCVYYVGLVKNGGTIVGTEIKSYTFGVGADLPAITRDNHTFIGWFNTDGTGPVTGIDKNETGDKRFLAKWERVEKGTRLYSEDISEFFDLPREYPKYVAPEDTPGSIGWHYNMEIATNSYTYTSHFHVERERHMKIVMATNHATIVEDKTERKDITHTDLIAQSISYGAVGKKATCTFGYNVPHVASGNPVLERRSEEIDPKQFYLQFTDYGEFLTNRNTMVGEWHDTYYCYCDETINTNKVVEFQRTQTEKLCQRILSGILSGFAGYCERVYYLTAIEDSHQWNTNMYGPYDKKTFWFDAIKDDQTTRYGTNRVIDTTRLLDASSIGTFKGRILDTMFKDGGARDSLPVFRPHWVSGLFWWSSTTEHMQGDILPVMDEEEYPDTSSYFGSCCPTFAGIANKPGIPAGPTYRMMNSVVSFGDDICRSDPLMPWRPYACVWTPDFTDYEWLHTNVYNYCCITSTSPGHLLRSSGVSYNNQLLGLMDVSYQMPSDVSGSGMVSNKVFTRERKYIGVCPPRTFYPAPDASNIATRAIRPTEIEWSLLYETNTVLEQLFTGDDEQMRVSDTRSYIDYDFNSQSILIRPTYDEMIAAAEFAMSEFGSSIDGKPFVVGWSGKYDLDTDMHADGSASLVIRVKAWNDLFERWEDVGDFWHYVADKFSNYAVTNTVELKFTRTYTYTHPCNVYVKNIRTMSDCSQYVLPEEIQQRDLRTQSLSAAQMVGTESYFNSSLSTNYKWSTSACDPSSATTLSADLSSFWNNKMTNTFNALYPCDVLNYKLVIPFIQSEEMSLQDVSITDIKGYVSPPSDIQIEFHYNEDHELVKWGSEVGGVFKDNEIWPIYGYDIRSTTITPTNPPTSHVSEKKGLTVNGKHGVITKKVWNWDNLIRIEEDDDD